MATSSRVVSLEEAILKIGKGSLTEARLALAQPTKRGAIPGLSGVFLSGNPAVLGIQAILQTGGTWQPAWRRPESKVRSHQRPRISLAPSLFCASAASCSPRCRRSLHCKCVQCTSCRTESDGVCSLFFFAFYSIGLPGRAPGLLCRFPPQLYLIPRPPSPFLQARQNVYVRPRRRFSPRLLGCRYANQETSKQQ